MRWNIVALSRGCGLGVVAACGRVDEEPPAPISDAGLDARDVTAPDVADVGAEATFDSEAQDSGADADAAIDADAGIDADAAIDAETDAACPSSCGPQGNADCCDAKTIPTGTFQRSNDPAYPATVSDFRLDTFEVTVGRFRAFVAGYPQNAPLAGSGKNPNDASDTGWAQEWNANLPQDRDALMAGLKCDLAEQTWTDAPAGKESKAISCISWYEAFAFCVWDKGRLPTEAEWNYVAAGGDEQRVYPWSVPPTSTAIDRTYAVYSAPGIPAIASVGSTSPKGDGRWGHADLAGNVVEWLVDGYVNPYAIATCSDCADHTSGPKRAARGGSVDDHATGLGTAVRGSYPPAARSGAIGMRCARAK